MPPKVKYTKEEVIQGAINVVEKLGLKQLTARSLAAELGSSTAPVYKHFTHMNDLALEVMKHTQKLLLEYSLRSYTDIVFLNMGTGVALFACEHKRLYKALTLEGASFKAIIDEFISSLEIKLNDDPRFVDISAEERRILLNKMWTFTHGLASMICVGHIPDCNLDFIIKTLKEMGGDVITGTFVRLKKLSESH